ncbi:MAG: hypothetical protein NXI10_15980 [bacterium]|nr:hypothetical protein [bacterium]
MKRYLLFIFLITSLSATATRTINPWDQLEWMLSESENYLWAGELEDAIEIAQEILRFNYDSLPKYETDNPKAHYHYNELFEGYMKSKSALIVGTAYFKGQQHDSSNVYLRKVSTPVNLSGIRNFTYALEQSMHIDLMRSVNFEKQGDSLKAAEILKRYLFLDRIKTSNTHWYDQRDIIQRYIALKGAPMEINPKKIREMPNYEAKDFFAWSQFGGGTDIYYDLDGYLCPVLPDFDWYNLQTRDLETPEHPFHRSLEKGKAERPKSELMEMMKEMDYFNSYFLHSYRYLLNSEPPTEIHLKWNNQIFEFDEITNEFISRNTGTIKRSGDQITLIYEHELAIGGESPGGHPVPHGELIFVTDTLTQPWFSRPYAFVYSDNQILETVNFIDSDTTLNLSEQKKEEELHVTIYLKGISGEKSISIELPVFFKNESYIFLSESYEVDNKKEATLEEDILILNYRWGYERSLNMKKSYKF